MVFLITVCPLTQYVNKNPHFNCAEMRPATGFVSALTSLHAPQIWVVEVAGGYNSDFPVELISGNDCGDLEANAVFVIFIVKKTSEVVVIENQGVA